MANDDTGRKADDERKAQDEALTPDERAFKRLHPQTWEVMQEEKKRDREGRA